MIKCNKRQKLVTDGVTSFRCINRLCEAAGHAVNEEACGLCKFAVNPTKPNCGKPVEPVKLVEEPPVESIPEKEVPNYPTMSMQMWLYKEALVRWNKAGRPTRSAEEVDKLLTTHCQPCDWYDTDAKRCKGCGCKISSSSVAIFNKLKMATEKCPKGLW